jgi:hypothetical protein
MFTFYFTPKDKRKAIGRYALIPLFLWRHADAHPLECAEHLPQSVYRSWCEDK